MFDKELKEVDDLKKQWQKIMPKKGIYNEKINLFYDVEFVYDSNKIEGSTLSLRETAIVLEEHVAIGGKPVEDHLAAINHKLALDYVKKLIKTKRNLSEKEILKIHELVLKHKTLIAGVYRKEMIVIVGSDFIPPSSIQVSQLMKNCLKYYNQNKEKLHPVILAADMHLKLVTIHPFADGNGRTSRLLMNYILLNNNYCLVNIQSKKKEQYYKALEESQIGDNPLPFRKYTIERTIESFKHQLKVLTKE